MISFVYDFFTLSNKKSGEDIGGLQFIPSNKVATYAVCEIFIITAIVLQL